MAVKITQKYELFKDVDGDPLENGYIYIGTTGLNPEVSPITVYFDEALTLPAAQPLRTSGGYIQNAGTPANIYVNTDYSITVRNKNETLIYTSLSNNAEAGLINSIDTIGDLIGLDEEITIGELEVYGYYAKGDGAGDLFIWDSTTSKANANGGTIIDPSVSLANQGTGIGTGAWIRQYTGAVNVTWFGASIDRTDNEIYFQKAINFARSESITVEFTGIFKTNNTIYGGASIAGTGGRQYNQIRPMGEFTALRITDVPGETSAWTNGKLGFSNFMIRYDDTVTINGVLGTTVGISILGGYANVFRNIEVYRAAKGIFIGGTGSTSDFSAEHSFSDVTINTCFRGIECDTKTFDLFIDNMPVEGCTEDGVIFQGGNHNARHIHSTKNGGVGYRLKDATSCYIDCHADTNTTIGFRIGVSGAGGYNKYIGCRAYYTGSSDTSNDGVGFYIDCDNNIFNNCNAYNVSTHTSQKHGLEFAGNSKANTWIGGEFSKNATYAIAFGASATNNMVDKVTLRDNAAAINTFNENGNILGSVVDGTLGIRNYHKNISASLVNSWVAEITISALKTIDGAISLFGAIEAGVNDSVAFTLPSDYKPAVTRNIYGIDENGDTIRIYISEVTGDVYIYGTGTAGWNNRVVLDGIRFPHKQSILS